MSDPVSIVVRTKNEEKWIASCLGAIALQDYRDFEVILVDNDSTDDTRKIAEHYGCTIVSIGDDVFNFSRALNVGIETAKNPLIAMISGHCVPADDQWLARLAMHFGRPEVIAAYGRQEPLPDTAAVDKRDLWISFGLDRKEQQRDYFFHNANSMIRRDAWTRVPFNEAIHGVEDQDWAKKVLRDGYRIVYEPSARVFHHHGIHHERSEERADRVVRVIELIQQDLT
jgi:glycosyltransferase involved in cell wall biosynthesis